MEGYRVINVIATIKNEGDADSEAWQEAISENIKEDCTPFDGVKSLISWFNATRHPGDPERILLKIRNNSSDAILKHTWRKKSLVTEIGGFDKYVCETCAATGKRFGITERVVPDNPKKVYCKSKEE